MEQSDSSVGQQEGDESVTVLQECLEFDLLCMCFLYCFIFKTELLLAGSFVYLLEFVVLPFILLTQSLISAPSLLWCR
jgi:Colicin immunity protein.